jgi:hypothetical protein
VEELLWPITESDFSKTFVPYQYGKPFALVPKTNASSLQSLLKPHGNIKTIENSINRSEYYEYCEKELELLLQNLHSDKNTIKHILKEFKFAQLFSESFGNIVTMTFEDFKNYYKDIERGLVISSQNTHFEIATIEDTLQLFKFKCHRSSNGGGEWYWDSYANRNVIESILEHLITHYLAHILSEQLRHISDEDTTYRRIDMPRNYSDKNIKSSNFWNFITKGNSSEVSPIPEFRFEGAEQYSVYTPF